MAYGRQYPMPQGSPGYNPYSKYPDFAGIAQQFIQNMMMKKQMEQGQQQQMWQRGMEEKKFESQDAYRQAQMGQMGQPQKPPTLPASVHEAIIDSGQGGVPRDKLDWGLVGKSMNKRRDKPTTPSTYSLRKGDLDKALKAGDITKDQYYKSLFNLKQELSPEDKRRQGASIRDGNIRELRDFYGGIPELLDRGRIKPNELRKMIEKQGGGIPSSPQGHRLDMPEKYNRAILNQKDGVATVEDADTIKNYDIMFKIFQEEQKKYPVFEDWIQFSKARNMKGLDKNQMKIWYDIFGEEKEPFLKRIFKK